MAGQNNAAPVIIKRKKNVVGGGHHGGAWKVAYADFVTAMMAFFMLMWLLNATTEKQRKGIADYFSPTIAISRVSGGGDGSFGGESVFSENVLPQNGTGGTMLRPMESQQSRGESGLETEGKETQNETETLEKLQEALIGRGGESTVTDERLKHIVTRVTDEGLVIELFSLEDAPLFDGPGDRPTRLLVGLSEMLVNVLRLVENPIAIEGHTQEQPVVLNENTVWQTSAARANVMRSLLEAQGMAYDRIKRLTGHGDKEPSTKNPMAIRNNRIEIILLRTKR